MLESLKESGIDAIPNTFPSDHLSTNGILTNKGRIFPIGGISNKTNVYCNEGGFWSKFESDEHGFNNQKGLYKEGRVEIILTGDSFVEGACVKPNNTIGSLLRKIGFNVISIGKGGNGPLIELAALKEFAEPLKPKIVLWFFYGNDLNNLFLEQETPFLLKYLNDDNFSQKLILRQGEIDSVLIKFVKDAWKKEKDENKKDENISKKNNTFMRIIKLYNLRKRIRLVLSQKPKIKPVCIPLNTATYKATPVPIFRKILEKSKQMVSRWGGKIYFVYLPSIGICKSDSYDPNRIYVINIAKKLDIPVIDMQEVFGPHKNPLSLLPLIKKGHYNGEGYKLVTKSILNRFEADRIVPIKSSTLLTKILHMIQW